MSMTMKDLIEMEQPEWLTQIETVLEVLNEGVVISDDRHRILFANSQFLEMTGFSRQELIGSDASSFYSSQEWGFLTPHMDIVLRTGRNRQSFVLPLKGGGRLPVIISSRTIQNSGDRFDIVTFADISEQVRAEKELRSANVKLQERQREIEEDLRLAARVQRSLAPRSMVWDKMSVDSFYHPVHSIGGDFALVNSLDREHLSLLVCDVSGHGIGSALVANRIYSETTTHLRSGMPFVDMFQELNRFLIKDIDISGLYVTVAAARIDAHRRSAARILCCSNPAAWFSAHCPMPWMSQRLWRCSSRQTTASSCIPTGSPKCSILAGKCSAPKAFRKSYAKHRPCPLTR